MAIPPEPDLPAQDGLRKPRKIFLLVGFVLAAALGVGLFTSIGTGKKSQAPHPGGPVPAFVASSLNRPGAVRVTANGSNQAPIVILFFGNFCADCHLELPPIAAAIRRQDTDGGPLSKIRIVGVDTLDTMANARSFIKSSGVTSPVAYDPNSTILNGDFYFLGDPDAVFVNGNGTINRIVLGDQLTPATFTADEHAVNKPPLKS